MIARVATTEEAAPYLQPEPIETWVGVLEDEGKIVGHLCLGRDPRMGQVFGYDMAVESEDATAALRLWRLAKAQCEAWGQTEVFMHVDRETPQRLVDFWLGRGAIPLFTILKLEL